jgi:hypothetical protein
MDVEMSNEMRRRVHMSLPFRACVGRVVIASDTFAYFCYEREL